MSTLSTSSSSATPTAILSSSSPRSSNGPRTPSATGKWQNHVQFLHHAFDDSDEDEDLDLIERGKWHDRAPLTPLRSSRTNALPPSSPSRFVVKGTVTPSRAAPLFARFTRQRRSVHRRTGEEWSEEEEDDQGSEISASPSKTPKGKSRGLSNGLSSPSSYKTSPASHFTSIRTTPPSPTIHSHFVAPSRRTAQLPESYASTPLTQRAGMATTNVASYLHAVRSNNPGHLRYAASVRGSAAFAGTARGALSASRALGAGSSGSPCHISQRSFYQTFDTTSTPSVDLFTLASDANQAFAHPLSAEYAHSSRCLSGSNAQWLALGSNEGRVFLINTADDADDDVSPSWSAHDGTIFEVKWRSDDEQIATGGSDYKIRIWNTASGVELASFAGHRGTPRSIAWDPYGAGHVLASGGRDGAIHVYDVRTSSRCDEQDRAPVMTMWGAHTSTQTNTRRSARHGIHAKGVTSLTYVPGRGSNMLCSAGCGDGTLKMWDLRALTTQAAQMDVHEVNAQQALAMTCSEQSVDVSTHYRRQNKSPHGISSIVAASTKIFAACTDGCIYTLPASSWTQQSSVTTLASGIPSVPLYDAAQRGNTLYARLALHEDERTLALGCNSGTITVWDTHAASLAAAELASAGHDRHPDHTALADMAKPAVLRGGHRTNYEINGISWAHGLHGPTLASISDDYTIRTWHSRANRRI